MSQTLLLNASWEPLRVLPLKRAVVLVLQEKAEVLEEGEEYVRSASLTMRVPKVIRLIKYIKVPYRARLPLSRRALVNRDKGLCQYCGRKGDTIDHVHPRSRGGKHTWENVVLACGPCNGKKGDRTLEELRWSLSSKPFAPTGLQWIIVGVAALDDSWEPYLGNVAFA